MSSLKLESSEEHPKAFNQPSVFNPRPPQPIPANLPTSAPTTSEFDPLLLQSMTPPSKQSHQKLSSSSQQQHQQHQLPSSTMMELHQVFSTPHSMPKYSDRDLERVKRDLQKKVYTSLSSPHLNNNQLILNLILMYL
jgi:hypothetical protein